MKRVQETQFSEFVVSGVDSPVRVRLVPMDAQEGAAAIFYAPNDLNLWFFDQIVSGADRDWVESLDPLDLERMVKAAIFVGYPWGVLMNPDLEFADLSRKQRRAIKQMPAQGMYLGHHDTESLIRLRTAIRSDDPENVVFALRLVHDHYFAADLSVAAKWE